MPEQERADELKVVGKPVDEGWKVAGLSEPRLRVVASSKVRLLKEKLVTMMGEGLC